MAQEDPIKARQALMKANGQQAALGAKMVKGEEPFDLAKAKAIFVTFQDAAAKAPALFPENSKTGGDTAADPKIWTSMDDFKAMFAKLGTDAKAAGGGERQELIESTYSTAMPLSANSFFAFLFLVKSVKPMPRSTLGALVN